MPSTIYSPGDTVRRFAELKHWNLKKRSVMVEGDNDVVYFELAAKLYFEKTRLALIGDDLSIFSAGTGDQGGTTAIFDEYPSLMNIIRTDIDQNGKTLFRVIALIDNDIAGRNLCKNILHQHKQLRNNYHTFVLQHVFPRTTSEPSTLTKQIEKCNSLWSGLDTEIEDLLEKGLIEAFFSDNRNAFSKPYKEMNGQRHYEFTNQAKSNLVRFVKNYATLDDMDALVDVLQSLRFYLGLQPDGLPCDSSM